MADRGHRRGEAAAATRVVSPGAASACSRTMRRNMGGAGALPRRLRVRGTGAAAPSNSSVVCVSDGFLSGFFPSLLDRRFDPLVPKLDLLSVVPTRTRLSIVRSTLPPCTFCSK